MKSILVVASLISLTYVSTVFAAHEELPDLDSPMTLRQFERALEENKAAQERDRIMNTPSTPNPWLRPFPHSNNVPQDYDRQNGGLGTLAPDLFEQQRFKNTVDPFQPMVKHHNLG